MPFKICIDAGHYAYYNQSPVVKDYWESVMTWKLHLELIKELQKFKDVEVTATREKQNDDLEVFKRGKKAKGCDLFISLHSNAEKTGTVDRSVVFYPFDNRGDSKEFALRMTDVVKETMGLKDPARIATRESAEYPGNEYYGVMRGARYVGCQHYFIIEHGFHTNEACARWLLNGANLKKLAQAEAKMIGEYFGLSSEEDFILGDVNGDGVVDAFDYTMTKAIVLGTLKGSEEMMSRADMNRDGRVDAIDYLLVKTKVLGGGK